MVRIHFEVDGKERRRVGRREKERRAGVSHRRGAERIGRRRRQARWRGSEEKRGQVSGMRRRRRRRRQGGGGMETWRHDGRG
jgi:hypothetical protein